MGGGPQQVQRACENALAALAGAFLDTAVQGSRSEWAGVIATAQQVVNAASAVQDRSIVQLAAIEPEWLEDGTVVESHRAPGHVALDAPAIVSGALSVSAVHAERRVRAAVRWAADGPTGDDTETGLAGLHAAMRAGRLDAYRAGVVAEELELAPPQVAASVVAALESHFEDEDGAHLRRRCRRVLVRISPDLLRQRAVRARAASGLRRWVDEPGVDRWEGTFPSEDAARAWAAIDALARRYVREQVCPSIDRARAKALTDLVAGNATIETVVTLTVPAAVLPEPNEGRAAEPAPHGRSEHAGRPEHGRAESEVASRGVGDGDTSGRVGDGDASAGVGDGDASAGVGDGDASACVGDGDLVEVSGPAGSQPVLVSRQWLAATLQDQGATAPTTVVTAACHPVTGALLDPDAPTQESSDGLLRSIARAFGADRYRPSTRLARRVRARDRRCRFPGCTVAAVFCDLDHVRPWPGGPTTSTNLICLCRRHHRVKQRPGWRVVLAADGTATWTDPTGRVRTTRPVDALHPTVLRDLDRDHDRRSTATASSHAPGGATPRPATGPTRRQGSASAPAARSRTVLPDGPHSELEFLLESRTGTRPTATPTVWRDDHGRHRVDVLPPAGVQLLDLPGHHRPRRRHRSTARRHDYDPPPF